MNVSPMFRTVAHHVALTRPRLPLLMTLAPVSPLRGSLWLCERLTYPSWGDSPGSPFDLARGSLRGSVLPTHTTRAYGPVSLGNALRVRESAGALEARPVKVTKALSVL